MPFVDQIRPAGALGIRAPIGLHTRNKIEFAVSADKSTTFLGELGSMNKAGVINFVAGEHSGLIENLNLLITPLCPHV